jgi:hypothetical protein
MAGDIIACDVSRKIWRRSWILPRLGGIVALLLSMSEAFFMRASSRASGVSLSRPIRMSIQAIPPQQVCHPRLTLLHLIGDPTVWSLVASKSGDQQR